MWFVVLVGHGNSSPGWWSCYVRWLLAFLLLWLLGCLAGSLVLDGSFVGRLVAAELGILVAVDGCLVCRLVGWLVTVLFSWLVGLSAGLSGRTTGEYSRLLCCLVVGSIECVCCWELG